MTAAEEPSGLQLSITAEQLGELASLAGNLGDEAHRCAEANCWTAALLATACVFEPELREAGLWKPPQDDPTRWALGQLADLARKARWLPSAPPASSGEIFENLDGQIGDALRFVQRLRNMIVHPGAYIRETIRPDVSEDDHMQATYELLDGIIGEMFVHLTAQMNTLGNQGQAEEQRTAAAYASSPIPSPGRNR